MTTKKTDEKVRCGWAGEDPTYVSYHDSEWGVPVYDDRLLFEFLVLEGAQAGLSWITILRKRDAYRKAFAGFDAEKVARFNDKKVEALMQDAGIVRNRLKIGSAIKNARAFLEVQAELGSFSDDQWQFVDGKPLQNRYASMKQVPARTPISPARISDHMCRPNTAFGGYLSNTPSLSITLAPPTSPSGAPSSAP